MAGLEARLESDPVPLLRLPGSTLLMGAGYSFDAPLRGRVRGYAGVSFRP